jgi:flavin reductase (DIM6/NTAB) family NADH-FMN oxidoreductase RutF
MTDGIKPEHFRTMMSAVCAPVTVVTTTVEGQPRGATVSSFASLSLQPPLVSIALDQCSALLAQIEARGSFGVNLLGHAQADLAAVFARRDIDRFATADWHLDHDLPRLVGAAGWFVCSVDNVVAGGDHRLVIGRVEAASSAELPPLIYAHRTFGTHSRYDERPRTLIVDQVASFAREIPPEVCNNTAVYLSGRNTL